MLLALVLAALVIVAATWVLRAEALPCQHYDSFKSEKVCPP